MVLFSLETQIKKWYKFEVGKKWEMGCARSSISAFF